VNAKLDNFEINIDGGRYWRLEFFN